MSDLYHGEYPVDMTVREALAEIHNAQPYPAAMTTQAEREERERIADWLLSDGARLDYEASGSEEHPFWWASDYLRGEYRKDGQP